MVHSSNERNMTVIRLLLRHLATLLRARTTTTTTVTGSQAGALGDQVPDLHTILYVRPSTKCIRLIYMLLFPSSLDGVCLDVRPMR